MYKYKCIYKCINKCYIHGIEIYVMYACICIHIYIYK